jgi:hypothetical protein
VVFLKTKQLLLFKTNYKLQNKIIPSLLTPVTAMLIGRGLRCVGVVLFVTTAEFVVEFDIALPGRDVFRLFGVISPERKPTQNCTIRKLIKLA